MNYRTKKRTIAEITEGFTLFATSSSRFDYHDMYDDRKKLESDLFHIASSYCWRSGDVMSTIGLEARYAASALGYGADDLDRRGESELVHEGGIAITIPGVDKTVYTIATSEASSHTLEIVMSCYYQGYNLPIPPSAPLSSDIDRLERDIKKPFVQAKEMNNRRAAGFCEYCGKRVGLIARWVHGSNHKACEESGRFIEELRGQFT